MATTFGVDGFLKGLIQGLYSDGGTGKPVLTVEGGMCTVDDAEFASLKGEASRLLAKSIDVGFADMPTDRAYIRQQLLSKFFTKENLCAVAMGDTAITVNSHNILRKKWMGEGLNPKLARKMGVVTANIPLKPDCQGWKPTHAYCGVKKCSDVTDEFEGGMPATMYATTLERSAAIALLSDPKTPPYYSKYQNSGPVACKSPNANAADVVAYHSLNVSSVYTLDLIMRAIKGDNYLAWTLLDGCKNSAGNSLNYNDLKFDFGVRIFLDMPVVIEGTSKKLTMMVTTVAAASNNALSGVVSKETARQRYYGGETAKKILLDATANGWKVEK